MAEVHWTLLWLLVAMTLPWSARASDVRQAQYKRNSAMDGLQLTTAALFQAFPRSRLHCGFKCSQVDGCRSYIYTAGQPSSCRGYDFPMTSPNADDTVPVAGTATFELVRPITAQDAETITPTTTAISTTITTALTAAQTSSADWLRTPCVENSECTVPLSECYNGARCLCIPGYYYSIGSKTCLADCPLTDLQSSTVKYGRSSVTASLTSLWHDVVTTRDTCDRKCYSDFASSCLAYNFNPAKKDCDLLQETALIVPPGNFIYDGSRAHFQRTCA